MWRVCDGEERMEARDSDVDDVGNVIVMMYVVYVHGGAMIMLDIPDGEK